jgi:DNA-binding SARP family transcriptional activator
MVEISTLGTFSIKIDGIVVSESFKKASKLLQLLNLLIINVNKPISASLICDAIWKEDDADAHRALQNLVYRLRNVFSKNNKQNCIVYSNNTYMLVPGSDWQIDIHMMDEYFAKSQNKDISYDEKVMFLEKAASLYSGEYVLNLIGDDAHLYATTNRYKRIYVDTVCTLADLYIEKDEHDKMFQLCDKAIIIEPLQESFYLRIVKGMQDRGEYVQAVSLIEDYYDIIYRAGIRASDELNNIYNSLKRNTTYVKSELNQILDETIEVELMNKAMYCSFETLKGIYSYEARQFARRPQHVALILADLCGGSNKELPGETLSELRKSMHNACFSTLRRGDIFADYSETQIVIMLIVSGASDADKVISRLSDSFYLRMRNKNIVLEFNKQNIFIENLWKNQ